MATKTTKTTTFPFTAMQSYTGTTAILKRLRSAKADKAVAEIKAVLADAKITKAHRDAALADLKHKAEQNRGKWGWLFEKGREESLAKKVDFFASRLAGGEAIQARFCDGAYLPQEILGSSAAMPKNILAKVGFAEASIVELLGETPKARTRKTADKGEAIGSLARPATAPAPTADISAAVTAMKAAGADDKMVVATIRALRPDIAAVLDAMRSSGADDKLMAATAMTLAA